MQECWKQLRDSKYSVSNLGAVRADGILMKLQHNTQGYLYVDIWEEGKRTQPQVHRLVATLFVDNPENKPTVNHINGVKADNTAQNLEWATWSENLKHAYDTGLNPRGSGKPNAKLTEADIPIIREMLVSGCRNQEVADLFGVSSGTISEIRFGRSWAHVFGEPLGASTHSNSLSKLSAEEIPVIRSMFLQGKNDAEIASLFSVARGTINQIRQGKTWVNY